MSEQSRSESWFWSTWAVSEEEERKWCKCGKVGYAEKSDLPKCRSTLRGSWCLLGCSMIGSHSLISKGRERSVKDKVTNSPSVASSRWQPHCSEESSQYLLKAATAILLRSREVSSTFQISARSKAFARIIVFASYDTLDQGH